MKLSREANNIPFKLIDGNDVIQVCETAKYAIEKARTGNGPFFIEAITYRWLGHLDWREDLDVGVNRPKKVVESWKLRDPIKRLLRGMIDANYIDQLKFNNLKKSINKEINLAWDRASNEPMVIESDLTKFVYSEKNK